MSLKSSEKTGTNEVALEISIGASEFNDALMKAYNKNKNKIEIPGFRKGKAPKALIEKYYGESVFYEDALDIAFPDSYGAALEEGGIDAVGSPFDIDVKTIGKEGVELSCKVSVRPVIELTDYKGIEAEKREYPVTDEDVDAKLSQMAQENARLIDVDTRPVQDGDIVNIDYEGSVDGKPFDGGKDEGHDLLIGSGSFIPGFEEQIIGHSLDEEFTIDVKFPDEYHAKDLSGKEAQFKVKINSIKYEELPDLDDEFAKDVSEFDTLEELKSDTKKTLKEEAKKRSDDEFRSNVLDKLAELVKDEIPECMIDNVIDDYIDNMEYSLRQSGLTFDEYLKYTKQSEEEVRNSYRDRALNTVKTGLALDKIAELEKIEPTEEDFEKQYKEISKMYGVTPEDAKKYTSEKTVKDGILREKAVDFVVENAVAQVPKDAEDDSEDSSEEAVNENEETLDDDNTDNET